MHNFYLVVNSNSGRLPEGREKIVSFLEGRGASVKVQDGHAQRAAIDPGTDCIIVLGGDGTIIRTATESIGMDIPIIGVNMGRLGYLTGISEDEEIIPMLEDLLEGNYQLEKRSLLKGTWKDAAGAHSAYAFNDIAVGHREALHAVRLEVDVNGEFLNEYSADGIIVATPTGSTAYNLSAGGPIVEACSDHMVVTPVCPHAMAPSAMVMSMDNTVEIKVMGGSSARSSATVAAFDGDVKTELGAGDYISITRAEYTVPMVRLSGNTYFNTLRRKLQKLHG